MLRLRLAGHPLSYSPFSRNTNSLDSSVSQQFHFVLGQSLMNMPTAEVWVANFIILVLIVCSAVMSASEIAYFSLSKAEVETLRESEDSSDNRIAKLLDKPRYLLSTILITNNLMNIGVVVTAYYVTSRMFNFQDYVLGSFVLHGYVLEFVWNVLIVTFFLVLFGEATPKVFATYNKLPIARYMSRVFVWLIRFYQPINYLLVGSTSVLEKKLKRHNAEIDIEEINMAIDMTVERKESKQDARMLKGIVHFGNMTVKQVMRPRMEVSAVDVELTFNELMSYVREVGYSRLPVYEGSLDKVVGVLYIKDLLEYLNQGNDFGWQKLKREPLFVPETKRIDDLLREIQSSRKHLAVVADEFGGTCGIITLEDIVEEVLGDIRDEFDDANESSFRKLEDGSFLFEGKTSLVDVLKMMELSPDTFDKVKGEAETLGGLLLEIGGRIPKNGEELRFSQFSFRIISVVNNRIEKVKVSSKI